MRKDIQEKLKGMPELLSIGQVAEIFNLHPDTLRNWEKEGILVPLRAGSRGDRKYRPQDIAAIVDKMGSQLTLPQLEAFLWKSADILRGKIDSSDYKKYIFGLLFYKRISDVWDEEYKKVMNEYDNEDIARADYNHRFQVPEDCRWSVITEQAENIGQKLNEIFEKLANANSPKLDKIFDDLDFANKDRFPNETLQRLINHFSQYNFGSNYISSDLLGDAYEYLIKQFAADAGKKGGEFYTPREVEKVIIGILKPHQKDHIYDPTVGSGGFLLEAYDYLKQKSGEKIAKTLYLYGQELNLSTFAIAKINMFLHGLDSADIRRGDTLVNPQFLTQQGALQTFDIAVANPPYSIKDWEYEAFKTKFGRLDGYDAPPDKNADYAFVLHIIKSLNANGRAGIVLPHGVLFRGGAEGRIREQILRNDLLEAVIALPAKLFYGTSIPAAILIFSVNKPEHKKGKVLIIDAENDYLEGKNQNLLRRQDIEKIVKAYEAYTDVNKYARVISMKEIEENGYKVSTQGYIDSSDKEELINVKAVREEIVDLKKKLFTADEIVEKQLDKIFNKSTGYDRFKETKIGVLPEEWDLKKIGDICVVARGGSPRPIDEYMTSDPDGVNWIKIGDIKPGEKYIYSTAEKIKKSGLNKTREVLEGDFILSNSMSFGRPYILKISGAIHDGWLLIRPDKKILSSDYLYYILTSPIIQSQFKALASGGVVKNLKSESVRGVYIPVPSLIEQEKISKILSLMDERLELSNKLKESIAKLKRGAMLDLLSGKARA